MALNGDTKRPSEKQNGEPTMHIPFNSWVKEYGKDAYKVFTKAHPKTDLSYEAWRQTDRVYGGYLFYMASLVWNEDDESDEETPKRRRISRVPGDNPKKVATTNGTGATRDAGSATPTPVPNLDEISASGKRKRRPRKKYMSQELVASDEEVADEVDAATPKAEVEASSTLETTANGRRKSGSRKPRKKPISDETISPEDEDDDPMELDAPAPTIVSPLPVRSAPHAELSKTTPKQDHVKKSKTSLLVRLPFHLWDAINLEEKPEEMVLDKEADNNNRSFAEVSRPATTPSAKSNVGVSNDVRTDKSVDEAAETVTPNGTPDTSAANTRRGLRNRKPAQKRPYYHDAQVFEDVESEHNDESELEATPRAHSLEPPSQSKPKHFKGKGRAWKKEDSDEDEEFFTPKEKKAAKAARAKTSKEEKAKAEKENEKADGENDITMALWDALIEDASELTKSQEESRKTNGSPKDPPKQKKKLGRPRKSNLSEDVVRGESDNDTPQATPTQQPRRGRGRPRKSALSSELVRDESDDEAPAPEEKQTSPAPIQKEANEGVTTELVTPPKTKVSSRPSTANSATTPKKRGRPRKSETSTTPAKSPDKVNDHSNPNEVEPQQHASIGDEAAAEPTPTHIPTPEPDAEYSAPSINRGAALIESLYPRDTHAHEGTAPVSSAPPTAPATAPAPTEAEAEPPASAATVDVNPEAAINTETETQAPSPTLATAPTTAAPPTTTQAPAPAPIETDPPEPKSDAQPASTSASIATSPQAHNDDNDTKTAHNDTHNDTHNENNNDKDDEGELSAAMSLSSDGEL